MNEKQPLFTLISYSRGQTYCLYIIDLHKIPPDAHKTPIHNHMIVHTTIIANTYLQKTHMTPIIHFYILMLIYIRRYLCASLLPTPDDIIQTRNCHNIHTYQKRIMEWNNSVCTMTNLCVLGRDLNIVTWRLGVLTEPDIKPKKRKINKRETFFDLLTQDILDIIKEMNGGIIHQENFVTVMEQLRITKNTAIFTDQHKSWFSLK